ncbi:MAG: hypothetical protein M3O50_07090 [Myxococcota bacterium]|nr:hypothetical protein [Myxococcota bacterium]
MRPAIVAVLTLLEWSGGAPRIVPTGAVRRMQFAFSTASAARRRARRRRLPHARGDFLRAEVTGALRPAFEASSGTVATEAPSGTPRRCPPPGDLRVVVVHPSSPSVGGARVVGPSREARLALVSERTSIP